MTAPSGRVLVIGLDGATWDVLVPMVNQGLLPHIGRFLRDGTWGPLMAPFPPVTAPSWTSFQTGVNPGRHGVFDFFEPVPGTYEKKLASLGTPPVPSLWDHVGAAGGRSVVVNLPSVGAPVPIDGVMISGMLSRSRCPVAPEQLVQELEPELGPYVVDVDWPGGDAQGIPAYLDGLGDAVRQRGRWARAILEREEWNLGIVVFVAPDRIQHKLFGAVDPTRTTPHPHTESTGAVFARLDEQIGSLVDAAGPDARVILVSDHGFGPARRVFEPNVHLAAHGLLARHPFRFGALAAAKRLRGVFQGALSRFSLPAAPSGLSSGTGVRKVVDWSKTRAFAISTTDMGIYINDTDRFPAGCVRPGAEREAVLADVEAALREVCDPETGRRIPIETMRRESIYTGPFLSDAPDLLFAVDGGAIHCGTRVDGPEIHDADFVRGDGNHRQEGIFALLDSNTPGMGRVEPLAMVDVAPTVLSLLHVPWSDSMDGAPPPWFSIPDGFKLPR